MKILMVLSYVEAVDDDRRRSGEFGDASVPSHICGGKRLASFAHYEDFVRLIGK
jgi:hypothetical protein